MQGEILRLFEGLTPAQVREFRRRIVPALEQVRREVTAVTAAKLSRGQEEAKTDDDSYKMRRTDRQR